MVHILISGDFTSAEDMLGVAFGMILTPPSPVLLGRPCTLQSYLPLAYLVLTARGHLVLPPE